jgi:shikimate kinase
VTAPSEPRRVVLVGFMGSGKSTVGPLLADLLGWGFLDLDHAIEERTGRAVPALFAEGGEEAFRQLELQMAEEVSGLDRHVVAAGGGAFVRPETRAALQRDALVVWLRVDLETALRRIPADGGRPLAGNRDIMRELFAVREPAYALADLSVEASDGAPATVARRVQAGLRERGFRGGRSDT